jgi:predicted nucleotidyltransferase
MGVNLPKGATLAGFRMPQVKQALKTYARTGQVENFLEVVSFAPSRMEAAVLYEELLEREFIDPNAGSHERFLTEAGLAIAGGKTRRSPLSTARRVLDDTLRRIEDMNDNSAPLNVVERVWLFGSVMRGEETVGDIDLAIETAHNPAFSSDSARSARLRELVDLAPDHLLYFRKLGWHEERGIFGERRHPLLAGAHTGSDELKEMGVPCQLIFDRSRGGRVEDAIIPRHPGSTGRSNEMLPPRQLPDLTPIPSLPAPMNARWMASYRADGRVSPHRLLAERTRVPGSGSHVMTDQTELRWHKWCLSSLKAGGYDGVSKVLLKFHETWSDPKGRDAAAVVMQRQVRELDTEIELRVALSDYERVRRTKPQLDRSFLHLCGMVAMVMCGDIHRQTMRLFERKVHRQIVLDLDTSMLPDELQSAAPIWIESMLQEFAPRAGALEDKVDSEQGSEVVVSRAPEG